jgi:hypothetical protein
VGKLEDIGVLGLIAVLGYLGYLAYSKLSGPVSTAASSVASASRGLMPLQTLVTAGNDAIVPGTGQSVGTLLLLGYTPAQVNQMLADAAAQYGTPVLMNPEAGLTTQAEVDADNAAAEAAYYNTGA